MQYIFHEPEDYTFTDVDGHDGKKFPTTSSRTGHLIIECHDKLRVHLTQQACEFNYYVIEGSGEFVFHKTDAQPVKTGDLITIPPGTMYTFRGNLKLLLINTPHYSPEQEVTQPVED